MDHRQGTAASVYQAKRQHFASKSAALARKSARLSRLRLLVSLGGLSLSVFLFWQGFSWAAGLVLLSATIVFIILVRQHDLVKGESLQTDLLLKINLASLQRLEGSWSGFADDGSEFRDENHPFSGDLDIFGPSSLFQLLNTSRTFLGRMEMRQALTHPLGDEAAIAARQAAVRELAGKLDWRQSFQVAALLSGAAARDPQALFQWAGEHKAFYARPWLKQLSWWLPCFSALALLGSFLLPQSVPATLPVSLYLIQAGLLYWRRRDMSATFAIAHQYKENIKSYGRMLQLLAEENWQSPLLQKLRGRLEDTAGIPAHQQVARLDKAVDMTYMRYNQLYFLFDIITLWDFHCQIALERWKNHSGHSLPDWCQVVGQTEMLASLAILPHDHPDWAWPQVSAENSGFHGRDLAHPLLGQERVGNNLRLGQAGEIFLITGSNMSGKSTLLRTAGINLVLAYAGTVVCAAEMGCGLMDLYTSMRTSDSLASSTSSFYAELLRIKEILTAAKAKKRPLFFLLDEVFKGTNSLDRHTGARHLLQMLSRTGAMGMVSTHDLELGGLAEDPGSLIKNFHFTEDYREGRLHFDYRLRPGISTTRNALYLMKMAGITLDG